jgi:hypothetical protein
MFWTSMKPDNTQDRKISMPPAGFELKIPASEQPQSHPLDRVATGIVIEILHDHKIVQNNISGNILMISSKRELGHMEEGRILCGFVSN